MWSEPPLPKSTVPSSKVTCFLGVGGAMVMLFIEFPTITSMCSVKNCFLYIP